MLISTREVEDSSRSGLAAPPGPNGARVNHPRHRSYGAGLAPGDSQPSHEPRRRARLGIGDRRGAGLDRDLGAGSAAMRAISWSHCVAVSSPLTTSGECGVARHPPNGRPWATAASRTRVRAERVRFPLTRPAGAARRRAASSSRGSDGDRSCSGRPPGGSRSAGARPWRPDRHAYVPEHGALARPPSRARNGSERWPGAMPAASGLPGRRLAGPMAAKAVSEARAPCRAGRRSLWRATCCPGALSGRLGERHAPCETSPQDDVTCRACASCRAV